MDEATRTLIRPAGPYDLALSLRAGRSFAETGETVEAPNDGHLRVAVWHQGAPVALGVEQVAADPPVLSAFWSARDDVGELRRVTERIVRAELDLEPFYVAVVDHPLLGDLTHRLHGLKPFRPASLYEMAVTAVVEQQISLRAAHHIRARLVQRFGAEVEGIAAFPLPEALAEASLEQLRECGLSLRKAEYVRGLSGAVAAGELDLEGLEDRPDGEVFDVVTSLRGFGPWSAEYLLVRGLGRVDVVPADDLGIRTIVGRRLGTGHRASAAETKALLVPFAPFRGLAAFYLLAAERLGLLS